MGYTIVDDVAGGEDIRILEPDVYNNKALIYFHGRGEDYRGTTEDSLKAGIIDRVTNDGWLVASSTAGGNLWGNDTSLTAYLALQTYLEANYDTDDIVFFTQSMGGLAGLRAAASGNYPKLRGCFNIYPATDVVNVYDTNVGFQSEILTAWSAANRSALVTAVATKNPIALSGNAFANLAMKFYASKDDTVVTKSGNTDPMIAILASYARECESSVCCGNHGDATHFQPANVAALMGRATNPVQPTAYNEFITAIIGIL